MGSLEVGTHEGQVAERGRQAGVLQEPPDLVEPGVVAEPRRRKVLQQVRVASGEQARVRC